MSTSSERKTPQNEWRRRKRKQPYIMCIEASLKKIFYSMSQIFEFSRFLHIKILWCLLVYLVVLHIIYIINNWCGFCFHLFINFIITPSIYIYIYIIFYLEMLLLKIMTSCFYIIWDNHSGNLNIAIDN